jgi:hypothetical protein
VTVKAKLEFIEEMVRWLEGRRKSLTVQAEKTE